MAQHGVDKNTVARSCLALSEIPVDALTPYTLPPSESDLAKVTAADVFIHHACKYKLSCAAKQCTPAKPQVDISHTTAEEAHVEEAQGIGHISADEAWGGDQTPTHAGEAFMIGSGESLTEEQVLSRAAAILHDRVIAMIQTGRQQPSRLPRADWMTSDSVPDLSVPTILFAIITGAAYAPHIGEEREVHGSRRRSWIRALSITHDILGCAGYPENAKWDAMALWLRTTVRQGSVIRVLNGAGCCGTELRARGLEKHASNVNHQEVDDGIARVVHANNGIVSFAFDNIDVSAGTLDGRSSHWMNGLAAVTNRPDFDPSYKLG